MALRASAMMLFGRRSSVGVDAVCPTPTARANIGALARRFSEERRISVDDFVDDDVARAVAAALPSLPFVRSAPSTRELSQGVPSWMFYEASVRPHRRCRRSCAATCAIAESLMSGPLLEFLRAVTGRPKLVVRHLSALALVKGSHAVSREGLEFSWFGTREWSDGDGGAVRFANGETWHPRFGTMHLVDADSRELTLVGEHRALYVVRASLGSQ